MNEKSSGFLHLIQIDVFAYALVGGAFLAFSNFITRSLEMIGGHGGVEAMQST